MPEVGVGLVRGHGTTVLRSLRRVQSVCSNGAMILVLLAPCLWQGEVMQHWWFREGWHPWKRWAGVQVTCEIIAFSFTMVLILLGEVLLYLKPVMQQLSHNSRMV